MGSIYTIEVPSGHQLKIEADSSEEALIAANSWHPDQAKETPVTAYGSAAAAAGGLGKGTAMLAGLPGDLGDLLNRGIDKGLSAVGMQPAPLAPNTFGSANVQKQMEKVTGEFHKPQNTAEKYIDTAASFVPGAVVAPGGVVSNAVRYGILPGLASEAAGQAAGEGSAYEPYARAAAGIVAGGINPARAVTPFPATPARQAAVDTLHNEGVTSLTAGQRTGSEPLRYLESAASGATFGGHRATAMEGEAQRQFTEAAMRRAGTGPDATTEVLAANQARLGQQFNELSARNRLNPDAQFLADLNAARRDYANVPASQQRAMVEGYINDIANHVRTTGDIPGAAYQEMRSRLSRQANSLSQSDPTLANALRDTRDALDHAMERSVVQNNPQDFGAWQASRREYSAQKLIEKAASKAGGPTAEGQITPSNLRNTLPKAGGGYARGEGDFNELARAGEQVMKPLPNSGTAQRMGALQTIDNALIAIPRAAAGRALMSVPVQRILANQLLTGRLPDNAAAQHLLMIQMLQRSDQPYRGPNLGPLQGSGNAQ